MGVRDMSQEIVLACLKKKDKKMKIEEIMKETGLSYSSVIAATRMLYKKWGLIQREEKVWREISWRYKG